MGTTRGRTRPRDRPDSAGAPPPDGGPRHPRIASESRSRRGLLGPGSILRRGLPGAACPGSDLWTTRPQRCVWGRSTTSWAAPASSGFEPLGCGEKITGIDRGDPVCPFAGSRGPTLGFGPGCSLWGRGRRRDRGIPGVDGRRSASAWSSLSLERSISAAGGGRRAAGGGRWAAGDPKAGCAKMLPRGRERMRGPTGGSKRLNAPPSAKCGAGRSMDGQPRWFGQ